MNSPSNNLRHTENLINYPGFDHPLIYYPITSRHKAAFTKALWKSHQELRGFIGWAKYLRSWDAKMVSRFVDDHINALLPNQHFLFYIGTEVVGMGSLVASYTPYDRQIALFVTSGYQGKGIGTQIVLVLKEIAFSSWGFDRLFYEHDALNEGSKKLPQKIGFRFSHSFDRQKDADEESGFWFSWVFDRPKGLPDGIIQGRPIEDFT